MPESIYRDGVSGEVNFDDFFMRVLERGDAKFRSVDRLVTSALSPSWRLVRLVFPRYYPRTASYVAITLLGPPALLYFLNLA